MVELLTGIVVAKGLTGVEESAPSSFSWPSAGGSNFLSRGPLHRAAHYMSSPRMSDPGARASRWKLESSVIQQRKQRPTAPAVWTNPGSAGEGLNGLISGGDAPGAIVETGSQLQNIRVEVQMPSGQLSSFPAHVIQIHGSAQFRS